MAKKLISYDDQKPGLGLPTPVEDQLSDVFPTKDKGPRELPRVRHGLKPVLHIDGVYPRSAPGEWSHRLLSVTPGEWWAYGRDGNLRLSLNGDVWFSIHKRTTPGEMGRDGLWLKTTSGTLLTTWHSSAYDPEIIRSTDQGATWTTVMPSTPGANYLGPCSLVQSPTTGNLFLIEYTNAPVLERDAMIWKSSDDGATWELWKQLPRDTSNPEHVTHGHSLFVDPIDNRIWAAIGDAPPASGIYRLTEDETEWEPVATNRQLDTQAGIFGGAVGMMFFPTHIAWGVDQSYSSGLTRMARSEIGKPVPDVELVMKTNSTCFYTHRTDATSTEWVMCASQEGGSGAIDNAVHFYRVADNGATVDEVLSIPHHYKGPTFSWAFPLGSPLNIGPEGMMWWGTNIHDGAPNTGFFARAGQQFSARVGWSNESMIRPAPARRYETVQSFSTGAVASLPQGESAYFGTTIVPRHHPRLYIVNAGSTTYGGSWAANPVVEVVNAAGQVINNFAAQPLAFDRISTREAWQEDTAPHITYTQDLTPGDEISFRVRQVTDQDVQVSGFIQFAWGV